MFKSIIKEIVIILLLIVAIMLSIGIIFYNYRPSIKKIPTAVSAYTLPDEMEEELKETIKQAETQNIIKTYRVDSSDLKGYEKTNDYGKGRINPFEAIASSEENTEDGTNTNQTPSNGTGIQGSFLNTVK